MLEIKIIKSAFINKVLYASTLQHIAHTEKEDYIAVDFAAWNGEELISGACNIIHLDKSSFIGSKLYKYGLEPTILLNSRFRESTSLSLDEQDGLGVKAIRNRVREALTGSKRIVSSSELTKNSLAISDIAREIIEYREELENR